MKRSRIWEIDLLRVIAITLMIIFHIVYDLNEFVGMKVDYESIPWFLVGKTSALMFMFVAGISSVLSKNSFKRGLQVFSMGMLITMVTFIIMREEYVRFGILHFLGVSMILSIYLRKLDNLTLILLSIASIFLGFWIGHITINTFLLLPFGVMYYGFASMDYYPLFPYIGVFMIGMVFGKRFYVDRRESLFNRKINLGFFNWVSVNSLVIYLVHQPIILAIILSIKFLTRAF